MTKKTNKAEVVTVEPQMTPVDPSNTNNPLSIETLLSQAIAQGVSVDVVERFLAMRRELKAEWSREQYNKAMAAFQADCPIIKKKKPVKDENGRTMYHYATLDDIVNQTKKIVEKHGFNYSFKVDTSNNLSVKVTCIIKHTNGHQEEYEMDVPHGNKTKMMSNSQVTASTTTFAKRYAYCNAFGIMTADEDVDGKNFAPQANPVSEEQRKTDADFEKAKTLLNNTKSIGTLRAFEAQLKTKTRYDKNQLKEIADIISKKTKELADLA